VRRKPQGSSGRSGMNSGTDRRARGCVQ
jgi:hypothetical protein